MAAIIESLCGIKELLAQQRGFAQAQERGQTEICAKSFWPLRCWAVSWSRWQARQTLPRSLSGLLAAGLVGPGYGGGYYGPGPDYGPGAIMAPPGYGRPGFGIGWVGPGYYYNPGYYDRYYHPRYGYCRSVWYQGSGSASGISAAGGELNLGAMPTRTSFA